jgi:hypothetical protein
MTKCTTCKDTKMFMLGGMKTACKCFLPFSSDDSIAYSTQDVVLSVKKRKKRKNVAILDYVNSEREPEVEEDAIDQREI